jgi:REP element-mobilizing transposase RayT
MARQVRIEFAGATYHVMARGDRREDIFRDERDREVMLETLGETAARSGWLVHAWALMSNHYHLLLETPEANLVRGMTWFQTTYTVRFNSRHRSVGHVFGGRYKAVLVERDDARYFTSLLDYIHLNAVRAGMVRLDKGDDLRDYRWSSLPGYIHPRHRAKWLHVAAAFERWGVEDTVAGRRELRQRLEARVRLERADRCGLTVLDGQNLQSTLRRGWYYGRESFREHLLELAAGELSKKRAKRRNYHGPEVREHGEAEAERLVREGLAKHRLCEDELSALPKGERRKALIAARVRGRTAVPLEWIARRLHMGTPANVSQACRRNQR